VDELLTAVRRGEHRAVARAITLVERSEEGARDVVQQLYPHTGAGHVVGITGAPGTGKSTLVNELAKELRKRDKLVGIIAVDPSSPFSGGALLGDRIRMRDLAGDEGIFIRSMASRGSLGGLAVATAAAIKVLDAAGFDVILVETVGAGQAEVDIANVAQTVIVIEAPGMGDDIQSIKAGILEIADLLVVNKADRPGASGTVKALRAMLHMGRTGRRASRDGQGAPSNGDSTPPWDVKVYETIATEGEGIERVIDAVEAHRDYLQESGEWLEREKNRSRQELEQLLHMRLMETVRATVSPSDRERLIEAVAARELDPYSAVAELFEQITTGA
jgi:LAO/AO transport system kinase